MVKHIPIHSPLDTTCCLPCTPSVAIQHQLDIREPLLLLVSFGRDLFVTVSSDVLIRPFFLSITNGVHLESLLSFL